MLGCDYGTALDVWSIGTVLFEIYTGKILFKGRTNNQMLNLCMQLRGRIPTKMLKRGQFTHMHFDDKFVFELIKTDDVTGEVCFGSFVFVFLSVAQQSNDSMRCHEYEHSFQEFRMIPSTSDRH